MAYGSDLVLSECVRCGARFPVADTDDECPRCLLESGGDLLRLAGDADSAPESSEPGDPVFATGTRLGPYEIGPFIARGGMGEVYRAYDTRLRRAVAIKAMHHRLARNDVWREHFDREARAVASLNHPHICGIYDVGHAGDTPFVVMELVDGETLASRLANGRLSIPQALDYGMQIAQALSEAHRHGIVHRDVKPANIIITPRGIKLLDFGLAGLDAVAGVDVAGTPMYMAPEQLTGVAADHKADLFALGVILHEMLAGGLPFTDPAGDDAPAALPPGCPIEVAEIIRRCLAERPADRIDCAADVVAVLGAAYRQLATRRSAGVPGVLIGATLAAALLIAGGAVWRSVSRPQPSASIRFTLAPPAAPGANDSPRGVAVISPDGKRVAWLVSHRNGMTSLAVQPLDAGRVTHLGGTDGARLPSWTSDGERLLFFASGHLRSVSTDTGMMTDLAVASYGQGATSSPLGAILFAPDTSSGLYLVPAPGQPPIKLRDLDRAAGEIGRQAPVFLPDSRHYLYLSVRADQQHAIFLGDLQGTESRRLVASDSAAAFAAPDVLLFTRQDSLHAVRFDAATGALAGRPQPIETSIQTSRNAAFRMFSASLNGTLVFHTIALPTSQLIWFDRTGRPLGALTDPGVYRNPALNEDGLIAAEQYITPSRPGLVIFDSHDSRPAKPLPDIDFASAPTWAPGGQRLAFAMNGGNDHTLFTTTLKGPGVRLLRAAGTVVPTSWSPDGGLLLYEHDVADRGVELRVASLQTGETTPYLTAAAKPRQGRFSPDGRWIAYASDVSGRSEIYVDSFPTAGHTRRISSGGGRQPLWRHNGRELFYITSSRHIVAMPVRTDGETFESGTPVDLFEVPRGEVFDSRAYAVSTDGQRVLLNLETNQSAQAIAMTATVVTNWQRKIEEGPMRISKWNEYTVEIVWSLVVMLLFLTAPTHALLSVDEFWDTTISDCPPNGPDCERLVE